MKKSVAVDLLKTNLVYPKPLYIGDEIFLPAKTPIKQENIDELNRRGIKEIQTEGIPQQWESSTVETVNPYGVIDLIGHRFKLDFSPADVKDLKGAYYVYTSLIEQLHSFFNTVIKGSSLDKNSLEKMVSYMLQIMRNHPEKYIGFILGGEMDEYGLAKRSVNTAILAALTAKGLSLSHHRLLYIITGAFLHDAGLLRLPDHLFEKEGALSEEEVKQMRTHPSISFQIATKELAYPNGVGEIVLQHHEYWNGNGYPNHLKGDLIDIGTQILSVAEAFESLVSLKPNRKSIAGYDVMKVILADKGRRFNPRIAHAFAMIMGVHPLGSIVKLSNGTVGRVVETRTRSPLRPKVQVIIDENQKTHQEDENLFIDLLKEKDMEITQALDMREFSQFMV
jgi:HD-GYP domain-containing protein (c-di-GMP phosphodiesterase class II)